MEMQCLVTQGITALSLEAWVGKSEKKEMSRSQLTKELCFIKEMEGAKK